MLSSISPVGESARGQRWSLTASAHALGAGGAGAALGGLLGWLGGTLGLGWPGSAALVVTTGLLGALADVRGRVPSLHRQVDQRWLTSYRGWVYGLGFGVQLGVGVATVVPASVVWVMWTAAAATASPSGGALVGLTFGVLRALPVVLAGRLRRVDQLRSAMARMDAVRGRAAAATQVGQALVVLGLLLVALPSLGLGPR